MGGGGIGWVGGVRCWVRGGEFCPKLCRKRKLYKADSSLRRTLLFGTNGVRFIESLL